ncbi:MAG: hypothetical protein JWM47_3609 [Acidimicrobiales bacterium]|nr:hypothetical protein [Acidimicrobiales bacterium]
MSDPDELPFSERSLVADPLTPRTAPVPVTDTDVPREVPLPPAPPRSFQASAGIQGRQFAEQCDTLLTHLGFVLRGRRVLGEVGVEIDQEAVSPTGTVVWFEYKGSVQGHRPGLRRTDTLKKAIANGALLRGLADPAPYVVITSHLPEAGSGAAMLATATELRYMADVICLYDPAATARLKRW